MLKAGAIGCALLAVFCAFAAALTWQQGQYIAFAVNAVCVAVNIVLCAIWTRWAMR